LPAFGAKAKAVDCASDDSGEPAVIGGRWQAPAAHLPFVSHVPGRSMQICAGSALLVGTLVHAPIVPVRAHDLHAVAQAVAQQTPCAQLLDMHSPPAEQKAPFGFRPHELPVQTLPGEQFASAAQAPKHLLPLQA